MDCLSCGQPVDDLLQARVTDVIQRVVELENRQIDPRLKRLEGKTLDARADDLAFRIGGQEHRLRKLEKNEREIMDRGMAQYASIAGLQGSGVKLEDKFEVLEKKVSGMDSTYDRMIDRLMERVQEVEDLGSPSVDRKVNDLQIGFTAMDKDVACLDLARLNFRVRITALEQNRMHEKSAWVSSVGDRLKALEETKANTDSPWVADVDAKLKALNSKWPPSAAANIEEHAARLADLEHHHIHELNFYREIIDGEDK